MADRVNAWVTDNHRPLPTPPLPARPLAPPTVTQPNVIDLTSSPSSASSSSSSSDGSLVIIQAPRPRPALPVARPIPPPFHPPVARMALPPRPPAPAPTPFVPAAFNPGFVSTSSGFGLSVKERLAAKMREDAKRIGVPIGIPKTAPMYRGFVPPPRPREDRDEDIANLLGNMQVRDDLSVREQEEALKELVGSTVDMSNVDTSEALPEGLKVESLYPHQQEGLHWLRDREKGKKRGGILADEMGLGKTVQMIALILAHPAISKPKTTLIICPVGLMKQWEKEIQDKTDGRLRVVIYHGTARKNLTGSRLSRHDVVITSYETAASDWFDPKPRAKKGAAKGKGKPLLPGMNKLEGAPESEDDTAGGEEELKESGALFSAELYRVILDEAHEIKGRSTKKHKACCALVSKYRWCLTGTPLQNSVVDLFALFEFLGKVVSPLHEYPEFKSKIELPLKNKNAKIALTRLGVVLKAIMLRRLVPADLLMPMEVHEVKGDFLYPAEKEFYDGVEERMKAALGKLEEAGTSNYTNVLGLILRMRQACSHPSLTKFKNAGAYDKPEDLEIKDPEDDASIDLPAPSLLNIDDLISNFGGLKVKKEESTPKAELMSKEGKLNPSTKITRMLEILEKIKREGQKTILFSQFTSMLDVIEPFLVGAGYKFVRFDGSMNPKQKAEVLDRIREDPKVTVILISIRCGSVGLNLTCCSRCILLDLWWNPAIEQQAFGRVQRIGQKVLVKVYKITVNETIEDRILLLQGTKAALAKAALDGGEIVKGNKLTDADIRFLFNS